MEFLHLIPCPTPDGETHLKYDEEDEEEEVVVVVEEEEERGGWV